MAIDFHLKAWDARGFNQQRHPERIEALRSLRQIKLDGIRMRPKPRIPIRRAGLIGRPVGCRIALPDDVKHVCFGVAGGKDGWPHRAVIELAGGLIEFANLPHNLRHSAGA